MKKVTVIMITYNHEDTIEQAIKSVLAQETEYSFEIRVFDDASTDGTSTIVRRLSQEYPDIVKATIREKNLGMKKNTISAVTSYSDDSGEYIASLEGDDYWNDPLKLQKQVQFLEENPDYCAVYHDFLIINEKGEEVTGETVFQGSEFTLQNLERWELPGQTSTLIARNVLEDPAIMKLFLKNVQKIRVTPMDRIYPAFFLKFGRIKVIPEKMSVYRMFTADGSENWTAKKRKNWNKYRLLETAWRREVETFSKNIGAPVTYLELNKELFKKEFQAARKNGNANYYGFLLMTLLIGHQRIAVAKHALKKE